MSLWKAITSDDIIAGSALTPKHFYCNGNSSRCYIGAVTHPWRDFKPVSADSTTIENSCWWEQPQRLTNHSIRVRKL
jgi:hypothetical protein